MITGGGNKLPYSALGTPCYSSSMSEPSTTTFVVWTQEFEFTLNPSGSKAGVK